MSASLTLQMTDAVSGYRNLIDKALAEYCRFGEGCPPKLREAIEYALLAPGKRIRPILALAAADACGGQVEAALPVACAVEMIHCYSLVHDDLPAMDDDDLRRGRPTSHVVYGEANAILTGDALLAYAFEIVAREIQPPEVAAACVAILARAAGPMALVGGQFDDLAAGQQPRNLEALKAIHRRKTGAMLTVSLELGAKVAGADEDQLKVLTGYGRALGMAFQITDDLLDTVGSCEALGKRTGKDAELDKLTYPGLMGLEASQKEAQRLTDEACAAALSFGEQGRTLELIARFVLERNK
ncbi:MAG: farnesyl diphosphate synthase [Planctomycetota bacterium]|nr:farnesyl diphosphate synthase [Planctomycetota bacterium]MEC8591991.1 farnesyl diphosphate synthase [Planctomycetota bacterium]MEC8782468.1 farnesyl diphosphate synthase [Planctomycetota bacterium]MEE3033876.1 farnesyl diphosphate synthase [Planctomycetota bacterium]MEE3075646.1 farnesyl diphosphate synthase [Planctomycetota bacterium]